MKYIRTKDGIGKVDIDFNGNYCVWYQHNWYYLEDLEKDIIKQADTIEELCDEFVYIRHDKPHYLPKVVKDLGALRENRWCDVFGAIWTDKGLIYVAKMKGTLPNGEVDWKLL